MTRTVVRLPVSAVAYAALLAAGCGSGEPERVRVDGSITFRGSPLPGGTVTFRPEDPGLPTVGGATVQNGRFEIPADKGLVPGRYRVFVNSPDAGRAGAAHPDDPPGVPPPPRELVPAKYNADTELRVDVTPTGPNTFDLDLP